MPLNEHDQILYYKQHTLAPSGHATIPHVQKLNRTFQYLATTVNKSIIIKRSPDKHIQLDLYADAGHMTYHDLRGHTGVLLTLNDNYVV